MQRQLGLLLADGADVSAPRPQHDCLCPECQQDTEAFLNHERYVGGKVQMSKSSWTRNVKKGINTESLNLWKGRVLYDEKYMANLKMQKTLGYS